MSKRFINIIALLLVFVSLLMTFSFGCSDKGQQSGDSKPPTEEQLPPEEQIPPSEPPPAEEEPPTEELPEEKPPVKRTVKLTIGSFNICHCADWSTGENSPPASPGKTAGLIDQIGYDVVGLQEVYQDGGSNPLLTNQTALLLRFSKLTYGVFGLGQRFEWGHSIGNAVISKYPILSKTIIPVPQPIDEEKRPTETQWYEDRVIVKATVRISNYVNVDFNIDYITTHFGLNPLEQENMVEVLVKLIDGCTNPVVLCGDFNSDPSNKVQKPLRERLISAADVVGKTNEFTASSLNPYAPLDYIFLSKEFRVISYDVIKEISSDHFPIRAEVEIDV